MMNDSNAKPEEITSHEMPRVARWAMDKTGDVILDSFESDSEGRTINTRNWYFEGRMPRRTEPFSEYFSASGKLFHIAVRVRGGHYRGERQQVLVAFTEYAAEDGAPLPDYSFKG